MSGHIHDVERVLVVHPDPETRRSVEDTLRRMGPSSMNVSATGSLSDATEKARLLDPMLVLLAIDETTKLALDLARDLRRNDRILIGLYNPLVIGRSEGELLRAATRAGISDFATVPISEGELRDAIQASPLLSPVTAGVREGRAFGFFSIKGGAGCTTAAVNTAVALAVQQGQNRVALLDGNLGYGTVCQSLGISPDRDVVDLARDLDHPGPLEAYLMREESSGLLILPSARSPLESERVTPEDMCRIVLAMRRRFRYVVMDVPNRLDYLTMSLLDLSNVVLVLTEPIAATISRTVQLLRLLEDQGFAGKRLRLVLNRQDGGIEGLLSERVVNEQLGRPVDVVIPYEKRALDALNRAIPLVADRPRSAFAQAIQNLAQQLASP